MFQVIWQSSTNHSINGYVKQFPKRKFNEWYSGQVKAQLDDGISIDDVKVMLQLTRIKSVHAGWNMEFHNHMTTLKGKEIIDNGWKTASISDVSSLF